VIYSKTTMGSERHWEMSWNYSQHTIGARRGPLDQYRYVWPRVFLAVLGQRPLPELPISLLQSSGFSGVPESSHYATILFRK